MKPVGIFHRRMEAILLYIHLLSVVACLSNGEMPPRTPSEQGGRWSHGCRGIPGLNQTVNTLRCPIGCTITIHQVTYGTKNRPGCPYEISHPVEPHCCQREDTDDCFQDKSQKIPMLQLLCREASNVCELSVDRVAIRCPRNAFSISTMRSILYSCACVTAPPTTGMDTETVPITDTHGLPPSTLVGNTDPAPKPTSNTTWFQRTEITTTPPFPRSQSLSNAPSVRPLQSATSTSGKVDATVTPTTTRETTIRTLSVLPSIVYSAPLPTTTTTTTGLVTSTTTTPWTLTADNGPTHGFPSAGTESHGVKLTSQEPGTARESLNGPLQGGIIGGSVLIVVISILAVVVLCMRRKRRKSEAQGTEEASQYAYEIMDISLRRPHPVVTQVPEMTSSDSAEEAHDICLEGQSAQGTFLEKKIQRYLITSIYAEIKDFKRLSQESHGSGKADVKITQQDNNEIIKPTPKPRKLCDLYTKVNKRMGKQEPVTKVTKTCPPDQTGEQVSTCTYGEVQESSFAAAEPITSPGYQEGLYATGGSGASPGVKPADTDRGTLADSCTYDKLMSCDTKNGHNDRLANRAASGPYDELYTTKAADDAETLQRVRYFDNCEYATLNVTNGQVWLTGNARNTDEQN